MNLMDRLALRAGTMGDYEQLAGLHYLAAKPVTATRVLVLADDSPTVAQRWDRMRGLHAEVISQTSGGGRVVGVLVESLPALGCAMRNVALPGRYTGWDRGAAAHLLNAEVRCISRVVVHPQWRGLGLAVRLVREALATMTTAYTEALAAMGRVHPFFQRAGMTEYRRPPHRRDQRLLDAMSAIGLQPYDLAGADAMGRLNDERRRLFAHELARWAGRGLDVDEQLAKARRHLLTEPIYYLKANTKEGR